MTLGCIQAIISEHDDTNKETKIKITLKYSFIICRGKKQIN